MTERRKRIVRLQIARAAVELFAEKGVAGTTGDDIAHAIGISTRTLWRYFPNKEGCVRPLLTSGLEEMAAELRGWPRGESLVDHLDRSGLFGQDGGQVVEPVASLIRMTGEEPALMAVWLDVHRAAEGVFAEILADRRGVGPDDFAVRVRAAALNAALRSAAEEQALRGADGPSMGALLRSALVALEEGFGPA
ncbi:helix-turn-helix domain-containing protein [Nocardiopsis sp. DSM 44743]|uniref:Helix-turn-helix domain-containing protein n=2 Tax=Nocardiopsis lambiniae TaxID=3075539 RepID=A0ABU2M781_9ACTN|nr:helix-turn-helix domain-containing protein [Nocardiopsis sp. DSM 44743]MDT0328377.1 helix-turn-helix domain-containing protein [Nocardiopsis sp. DSM 44743]